MKALKAVPVVLFIAAVLVLVLMFNFLRHWAAVHTGTLNESGPYYGFWSGFGSDLGEYVVAGAIVGSAVTVYRRHKCAACPRIGIHIMPTGQKTCHHHTTRDDHARITAKHKAKYPNHLAHTTPPTAPAPARRPATKKAATSSARRTS